MSYKIYRFITPENRHPLVCFDLTEIENSKLAYPQFWPTAKVFYNLRAVSIIGVVFNKLDEKGGDLGLLFRCLCFH